MAGIIKVDRVQSDSNLAFNIAGSNVAFMDASTLKMVGNNISLAGTNVISSGRLITAGLPIGTVLQVVSVQYNTQTATSSGTYVDTGLQASITPTSSTSRILALATLGGFELTAAAQAAYFNLTRDATQIFQPNGYVGYPNGVLRTLPAASFMFLDSPATTSSTTYKVRFFTASALGAININCNASQSSITLMEIAA